MANGKSYVYRNPRPNLTIEPAGGASLGRCYSATYFRVTSLHPLSMKNLGALREAGFLGYGQEFSARQVIDEKGSRCQVPNELDWRTSKDVQATGVEDVPCVEVDDHTGKPTGNPPVNPYSGELYKPSSTPYFTYECEDRCDSSD